MVAVTYGVARVPAKAAGKSAAQAASRKTWFARFMDALVESRMQQAQREIAKHIHLFPSNVDESNTPFGGW